MYCDFCAADIQKASEFPEMLFICGIWPHNSMAVNDGFPARAIGVRCMLADVVSVKPDSGKNLPVRLFFLQGRGVS